MIHWPGDPIPRCPCGKPEYAVNEDTALCYEHFQASLRLGVPVGLTTLEGETIMTTYTVTPDTLHHILRFAFDTSGEYSQVVGRW